MVKAVISHTRVLVATFNCAWQSREWDSRCDLHAKSFHPRWNWWKWVRWMNQTEQERMDLESCLKPKFIMFTAPNKEPETRGERPRHKERSVSVICIFTGHSSLQLKMSTAFFRVLLCVLQMSNTSDLLTFWCTHSCCFQSRSSAKENSRQMLYMLLHPE